MAPSIPTFMQALADAFLKGDHKKLADVYSYPLAIFLDGEIVIEKTSEDALNNLFIRRGTVLAAGAAKIETTVLESGETSSGRFPVTVAWRFLNETGTVIADSEMRYFCRFTDTGAIKIEIIEFLRRGIESPESDSTRSPKLH